MPSVTSRQALKDYCLRRLGFQSLKSTLMMTRLEEPD
jgi:hypothetical protein